MKALLILLCFFCFLAREHAKAVVTFDLIESTSQVWHDSEEGDSLVTIYGFNVTTDQPAYFSRFVYSGSSHVDSDPGLVISFEGIPEQYLKFAYYVSFSNILALGPTNYLAPGRVTEMYVVLTTMATQPGLLAVNLEGIVYNTGGPPLPSQPLPIGPSVSVSLGATTPGRELQAIPEPSVSVLGLFASLFWIGRRRRNPVATSPIKEAGARERPVFLLYNKQRTPCKGVRLANMRSA